MDDLVRFRHNLHEKPELSNSEKKTSETIKNFLESLKPDKIIKDIGGYGIVVLFDTKKPGPSILFRAELDALPINEESNLEYKSNKQNVAHSCGHDGHISILLGLGKKINNEKENLCGKIYLLFQPAEETAQGAKRVLENSFFKSVDIDYCFALHNLPGFKKGEIILKKDVFAATSKGLIIKLKGKSSHAGHPENGNNPIFAMIEIINGLNKISNEVKSSDDRSLITIIHVKLGEVAFGTSPGKGVVMATFRSTDKEKMDQMSNESLNYIKQISQKYKLKNETEWVEVFPILINDGKSVDIIKNAAINNSYSYQFVDDSFSWTEDFSYFTQKYKGAFFGIGSGLDHPQLHNSDYDFPDDLIKIGINMHFEIIKEIIKNNQKGGEKI